MKSPRRLPIGGRPAPGEERPPPSSAITACLLLFSLCKGRVHAGKLIETHQDIANRLRQAVQQRSSSRSCQLNCQGPAGAGSQTTVSTPMGLFVSPSALTPSGLSPPLGGASCPRGSIAYGW